MARAKKGLVSPGQDRHRNMMMSPVDHESSRTASPVSPDRQGKAVAATVGLTVLGGTMVAIGCLGHRHYLRPRLGRLVTSARSRRSVLEDDTIARIGHQRDRTSRPQAGGSLTAADKATSATASAPVLPRIPAAREPSQPPPGHQDD